MIGEIAANPLHCYSTLDHTRLEFATAPRSGELASSASFASKMNGHSQITVAVNGPISRRRSIYCANFGRAAPKVPSKFTRVFTHPVRHRLSHR